MSRPVGLGNSLMLAPLIGVSDSLPKALEFLALCALILTFYGLAMHGMRRHLDRSSRLIASLILAATGVSVVQLLLQAFALALYQQLGLYLALLSVQCVVFEYTDFFETNQNKARWQLFGLFSTLLIILGMLRGGIDTTLLPAGFILLGLLLAGFQAWAHFSRSR